MGSNTSETSSDAAAPRQARLYRGRPLRFYAVLESSRAEAQTERQRQNAQQRRALRRLAYAWAEIAQEAQHRDEGTTRAMHTQRGHDSDEAARLLWLEIEAEAASPIRDPQRRAALFRRLTGIRRRQHG